MRVLVTGAAGRIGRRVVRDLSQRQFDVAAVVSEAAQLPIGVREFRGDLVGRMAAAENLIRSIRPDAIVHLAALAGAGCEQRPEEAQARNVGLTRDLAAVAVAAGVPRFIFSSSSAVYHQTELTPTREDENVGPVSVYGRTKLAAEESLTGAAAGSDTGFTTLRIFNVYGPGMDASLHERLLHSSPERPVELTGWRNFYRDYLHADEVARALVCAVLAPGRAGAHEVANVGSGVARNNVELIAELERLGVRPSYRRVDEADPPSYSWADVRRAEDVIGYRPKVELVMS